MRSKKCGNHQACSRRNRTPVVTHRETRCPGIPRTCVAQRRCALVPLPRLIKRNPTKKRSKKTQMSHGPLRKIMDKKTKAKRTRLRRNGRGAERGRHLGPSISSFLDMRALLRRGEQLEIGPLDGLVGWPRADECSEVLPSRGGLVLFEISPRTAAAQYTACIRSRLRPVVFVEDCIRRVGADCAAAAGEGGIRGGNGAVIAHRLVTVQSELLIGLAFLFGSFTQRTLAALFDWRDPRRLED